MSSSSPVAALPDRPVAALPRRVSWAEQALMIFAKDVAIELRTGEVVTTSAFFGFVIVIMSSLSFYASDITRAQVVRCVAVGLFTQLDDAAIAEIAHTFDLGDVQRHHGVEAGTVNSNYRVETARGAWFVRPAIAGGIDGRGGSAFGGAIGFGGSTLGGAGIAGSTLGADCAIAGGSAMRGASTLVMSPQS